MKRKSIMAALCAASLTSGLVNVSSTKVLAANDYDYKITIYDLDTGTKSAGDLIYEDELHLDPELTIGEQIESLDLASLLDPEGTVKLKDSELEVLSYGIQVNATDGMSYSNDESQETAYSKLAKSTADAGKVSEREIEIVLSKDIATTLTAEVSKEDSSKAYFLNSAKKKEQSKTVTAYYSRAFSTIEAPTINDTAVYEFAGWVDADGNDITDDKISKADAGSTITAKLNRVQIEITLDAGEGGFKNQDSVVTYEVDSGITYEEALSAAKEKIGLDTTADVTDAPEGYKFAYYTLNLEHPKNAAESKTKVKADTTLYVYWVADDVTYAYDPNGGTIEKNNHSKEAKAMTSAKTASYTDEKITVAENVYEREGFIFVGWNTKADGTGKSFEAGKDYTFAEFIDGVEFDSSRTMTLYADWQGLPFKVTYIAFDDANTVMDQDVTAGEEYTTLGNETFTKEGYDVAAWFPWAKADVDEVLAELDLTIGDVTALLNKIYTASLENAEVLELTDEEMDLYNKLFVKTANTILEDMGNETTVLPAKVEEDTNTPRIYADEIEKVVSSFSRSFLIAEKAYEFAYVEDMYYVGLWVPSEKVLVDYEVNGTVVDSAVMELAGEDTVAEPVLAGYTFKGWRLAGKTGEKRVVDGKEYDVYTKTAVFEASTADDVETLATYRLYNPNSGEHFYTQSETEREYLIEAGWTDEGIGWYAPTDGNPVYRLYNAIGGEHHYTMNEKEAATLVSLGWKSEGIAFYSAEVGAMAVYREYNPNAYANNHNYTMDMMEHTTLVSLGWKGEGIGWYAYAEPETAADTADISEGIVADKVE